MAEPSPHSIVCDAIRAEMARCDVTQIELAARLGENRMWVARRLTRSSRGQFTPLSVGDLYRISRALKVPAVTFVRPLDELPEAGA